MQSNKYSKKIVCEPGKVYYKMNEEGELLEIAPEIVFENKFITHKSNFMKVFIDNIPKIIEVTKEYYKYVSLLQSCVGYDNDIDMIGFRQKTLLKTPQSFSRVKAKLIELGVIKKSNMKYYYNPIIAIKSEKISIELWELFQAKNRELYKIEKI